MQVILLEKVANLGNLGDVVKVRDGYARNFLIPTHVARRACAQPWGHPEDDLATSGGCTGVGQ